MQYVAAIPALASGYGINENISHVRYYRASISTIL